VAGTEPALVLGVTTKETEMTNRTWTVTFQGKTVTFEQDYNVENGSVAQRGTTMARPLDVFLAGLAKMREAGAKIEEGTRS
jgi:hypothetical protein